MKQHINRVDIEELRKEVVLKNKLDCIVPILIIPGILSAVMLIGFVTTVLSEIIVSIINFGKN